MRPKTKIQDRLGPAVNDEQMLAYEEMEAKQRAVRELQIRIHQQEEDLREQEQRQWEEEARKSKETKAKQEAEQEKKRAVFRNTTDYQQNKKQMTQHSILKDPLPTGFSQLPPK